MWPNWCSHYYSVISHSTDINGTTLVEYMCGLCGHRYSLKYVPLLYTTTNGTEGPA